MFERKYCSLYVYNIVCLTEFQRLAADLWKRGCQEHPDSRLSCITNPTIPYQYDDPYARRLVRYRIQDSITPDYRCFCPVVLVRRISDHHLTQSSLLPSHSYPARSFNCVEIIHPPVSHPLIPEIPRFTGGIRFRKDLDVQAEGLRDRLVPDGDGYRPIQNQDPK